MFDLAAPTLPPSLGERLSRADYKREFWQRDAEIRNGTAWKLERRQHFEEQGSASRDALRHGAWDEALRRIEERRDALLEEAREDERRGYSFYRVRVVERPLTPYIQWELHSLRQRALYGQRIRVVDAGAVADAERSDLLPEVVILDGRTLYNVLYSERGVSEGAVRFTEPALVGRWENYVRALYGAGEEMASFFDREVAHLPAPKIQQE